MPDRAKEKLVDIVCDAMEADGCIGHCNHPPCFAVERVVNALISHGVTVQEWISVTERLPTIYDADADNCVLAIHKASNKRYYHWRSVADNPFDFTHWMRTPQPPKGE